MSIDRFYDDKFYDQINVGSRNSALVFVKLLNGLLGEIDSVVDFGCGQGVWLAEFQGAGTKNLWA